MASCFCKHYRAMSGNETCEVGVRYDSFKGLKPDCPVCCESNVLQFTRSGYNGHIHAKCATDGCVSWME